jgi:hypothetical protein
MGPRDMKISLKGGLLKTRNLNLSARLSPNVIYTTFKIDFLAMIGYHCELIAKIE